MKICYICKIAKKLNEFHASPMAADKHHAYCKKCTKEYSRLRYLNNKGKVNATNDRWAERNKERIKVYTKKYNSSAHGKKVKRAAHLKRKFKITLEQYAKMLKAQGNRCGICKRHRNKFKRDFCTDHNHDTGRVRGLLCNECNTKEGWYNQFKDDMNWYLSTKNKIAVGILYGTK